MALGFEAGRPSDLTVARRGAASWRLTTTGVEAHSAGLFREGTGYGAIYELARILDEFRRELSGVQYLTFNAAAVLGGTDVAYDSVAISGTAASKLNIVPRTAVAHGDLRFIAPAQHDSAKRKMAEIVARHLPGTGATIVFEDEYPAMPPTPGNSRVLAVHDTLSRALGYGEVVALDPGAAARATSRSWRRTSTASTDSAPWAAAPTRRKNTSSFRPWRCRPLGRRS